LTSGGDAGSLSARLFAMADLMESSASDGSPGSIEGRIVESDGRPVPAARIFVIRGKPQRPRARIATVTGADGRYRVTHLDPGAYTVRVVAQQQGEHEGTVTVRSATIARLDFVL
jgi:protocatechuate 3,4-dioxygenase beta subunit